MDYHYITRTIVAAFWFALFQLASSVPIRKQSESRMSEKASLHKRSAASVDFLMNSVSHYKLLNRDDPLEGIALASQQDFNNEFVCPQEVSKRLNDPVHKRSICPWYYRASHDPTRFPAVVLIAEPLCDYAIDSNGAYECLPITQNLTVLRQQNYLDGDGNYVWEEETMTPVIGFTAAGRRLTENSPQSATEAPNNEHTPEWAKR